MSDNNSGGCLPVALLLVLTGIVAAMRGSGATRFAWRQGRYQKYKTYRRI